jgi:hypothetical protein
MGIMVQTFFILMPGKHCLNRIDGIYRMDRIRQPWVLFILIQAFIILPNRTPARQS